jgi:hypothetical protein
MISVKCPNQNCPASFQVPDAYAGKNAICKKCKTKFKIGSKNGKLPNWIADVQHTPTQKNQAEKTSTNEVIGPNRNRRFLFLGLAVCLSVGALSLAACLVWTGYLYIFQRSPEVYGGIDISSKEVRVFVYEFHPDRQLGFNYRSVYNSDDNEKKSAKKESRLKLTDDGEFDPAGLKQTVDEISSQCQMLQKKYSLSPDRIVILASSGAFKDVKKLGKENKWDDKKIKRLIDADGKDLQSAVLAATKIPMEIVELKQELDLQIDSMIPERLQDDTAFIDMGSSACRGGCKGKDSSFSVDGVLDLTEKVQSMAQKKGYGSNFSKGDRDILIETAKEVVNAEFRRQLTKELENKRQITGKQRLEITGGVPFVIATYEKPAERLDTRRRLTRESIDHFYKDIREERDFPVFKPPVPFDGELKKSVEADLKMIRENNNLKPEYVIVGTEMLKVIAEELRFDRPDREVYFNNNGQQAALLGLMSRIWETSAKK